MTKDRVCANTSAMSRRAFSTALPASVVTLTLPAVASQEPDPVVMLYREWLEIRREWRELTDLPGNGNFDDPRSLAAEAREDAAAEQMMRLKPTSLEGVAAMAALAWAYIEPGHLDPKEYQKGIQTNDCRAVLAIWKACTGKDGYPVTL